MLLTASACCWGGESNTALLELLRRAAGWLMQFAWVLFHVLSEGFATRSSDLSPAAPLL